MEYYLNRINVVLIALVGGLCVWQWSGEKQADGQIETLRRTVAASERHAVALDQALRGATADIDEFKKVIASLTAKSDGDDLRIRQQYALAFTLQQAAKQHAAEADIWKKTFGAYKGAVSARDGNIQLLLSQRQQLMEANRAAVGKATKAIVAYNDLAAKYADLVTHYNDLAKRYKAEHPPAAAAGPSS